MVEQLKSTGKRNRKKSVCSECGGRTFFEDTRRGEIVCTTCGCVMSAHEIDSGPEWRAFTAEERNSRARTGSPMTYLVADKGLSTMISRSNSDAKGKRIKSSNRASIYRMRKWHLRTIAHKSNTRNLMTAMRELDRLGSQLGVSRETRETAALVYRKALKKKLVRGRTINGVIAASLYIACRKHDVPRQLDEVTSEAKVNRKELSQCVRLVLQNLPIKIQPPSPKKLIPRLSSDLGVKGKTAYTAISILETAKKKGLTIGKDPGGLAAAALYIAGILENDKRTQREIAEIANVTEVTVRNRYKGIVKSLGITMIPSK